MRKAVCETALLAAQIRTEVLQMLQSLPIDLQDEQRKSQMKKSQLGHVVMFLSKPEVEDNRANRRIARVHPFPFGGPAPMSITGAASTHLVYTGTSRERLDALTLN